MTSSEQPEWRRRRHALQIFLADHYNAIATAELNALGFSSGAIGRLKRDGWVQRRTRGVYVGSGPKTLETTLRLALLRHGSAAALTRRSAAHHLGHLRFAPPTPQILVPGVSGFQRSAGVERHGASNLGDGDLIVHRGLQTTSAYRTILDLAADTSLERGNKRLASEGVLRWVLRSATNEDHGLLNRLRDRMKASPFPGSAVLSDQIGRDLGRTQLIRSTVEDRFVELCRRFDLPIPRTNVVVHGIELDVFWEDEGAYLELDTYETHGGPISFERDRANAGLLSRHGLRGFSVTDRRIDYEAAAVADDVRGLLRLD